VTTRADATAPESNSTADGRRLRRDRNREAVVDALLELFAEGNLNPSADEIAARCGVSARSVFRYFDDIDMLGRVAFQRQQQRVMPLVQLDAQPDDAPFVKATALAEQRSRLFEAIESVGTVVRLRAPFNLVIATHLAEGRAHLRQQIADLFAPELATLPPAVAAQRLATADVLASFESWRLLRDDQHLSISDAIAALSTSLCVLLDPTEVSR
jgi:AcrR family transcriptional regulator